MSVDRKRQEETLSLRPGEDVVRGISFPDRRLALQLHVCDHRGLRAASVISQSLGLFLLDCTSYAAFMSLAHVDAARGYLCFWADRCPRNVRYFITQSEKPADFLLEAGGRN